ncbi:PAS domain S-box protein [Deinococcus hohokamensis]|uniref:PAS domain S-box protein n=1 Tax=Deinococcus hohokamensis TaxID=309883 RepID=A0ABV9I7N5_9DEIO
MTHKLPHDAVRAALPNRPGFELLRRVAQEAPECTLLLAASGRIEYANPAARRMLGQVLEGQLAQMLLHPDDLAGLRARFWAATEATFLPEFRVRGSQGGWLAFTGQLTPLLDDPAVCASLLRLQRVEHPGDQYRPALAGLSRALGATYSAPEVVETVLKLGLQVMQAPAGSVALLSADGQEVELAGHTGYGDLADRWARFPVNLDTPITHAIRSAQALFLSDRAFRERYPELLSGHPQVYRSAAVLPLTVGDRVIGAVALSFDTDREFVPEEREFLQTVADLCAPALDRSRLYHELRREQAWYHTVTRNSSDIATVLDEQGVIRYESGSVERLLGYSPDELLGIPAFALIHPDDHAHTQFTLSTLQPDEPSAPTLFRFRHKDGRWVWLEGIAVDLRQEEHVRGILVNSRDVTASEEAQAARLETMRALELSERNFRHLALGSGDLVRQHDLNGRVEYSSPAAQDVLGCSSRDLLGTGPWHLAAPDDQPALAEAFSRRFLPGFEQERFEYRVHQGGEWVWVETIFKALRDPDSQTITGFISATRKIEQRKQAERQLRAQLDRYRHLLDFTASLERLHHADELAEEALNKCLSLTEYDYGYALTCAGGQMRLSTQAGTPPPLGDLHEMLGTHPLAPAVRQALARHEACFLEENDPLLDPPEARPRAHWRSLCLLPITPRGDLVTVLVFGTDEAMGTSAETRQLLGNVAARLSHALERQSHLEQLNTSREETLRALGLALEYRDYETKGHTDRVVALTEQLGRALGFTGADLDALRWGAFLHDTGKVAIPDAILLKPGKLTEEEWQVIKRHPTIGFEMLHHIPSLPPVTLEVVLHHQERWNGSGYPLGLSGAEIPLAARVFAVVDVYDALTSERPYKPAWTHEAATEQLRREAGMLLDDRVVTAFLALLEGGSARMDEAPDHG